MPHIILRVRDRASELAAWLWRPRPVRLRPAYALAVAATFLLVLLVTPPAVPPMTGVTTGGSESRTQVFVQFRLDAPDASSVRLAGSFTGWEPEYALHEGSPGIWSILVPLPPGVHEYSFMVDDLEWRPDPAAPRVNDGFGGENSRVAVVLPGYQSL